MEALKILEGADVLYISVGEPPMAVRTDIGEGAIVRYDEKKNEVVGITIIGLRARTLQSLSVK
ncbi:MAG: hypothetical protein C4291_09185 [Candidatus Dadabacteria bacterium]